MHFQTKALILSRIFSLFIFQFIQIRIAYFDTYGINKQTNKDRWKLIFVETIKKYPKIQRIFKNKIQK